MGRNQSAAERLLDRGHVLGARSLRALALGVLDLLAFAEAVVAPLANNRGAVEEDVSPLTLDEPKTLFCQLLNRTSQRLVSHSTQDAMWPPHRAAATAPLAKPYRARGGGLGGGNTGSVASRRRPTKGAI